MSQVDQNQANMYGYASDEVVRVPFNFGLNAGKTHLVKFEWIPNGGKEGAEQEALEIVFNINGTERGYRQFPVTKAFGDNNEEITDRNHPKFKEAVMTLNTVITHIMHCFVDGDTLKNALNRPIASFKEFAQILVKLLPANYIDIDLDIFLQYQWQIRTNQTRTFLEIPKSMKNGKWLTRAITPVGDSWIEKRKENPADNDQEALFYVDSAGNRHIFTRYGKYMKGNLANQQVSEEDTVASQNIAHQDTTIATDLPAANAGPAAGGW